MLFGLITGAIIVTIVFILFAGKNQKHIAAARTWLIDTYRKVVSKIGRRS